MEGLTVWQEALNTTLLGLGTVFVGLFGLILVTMAMGYICSLFNAKKTLEKQQADARKVAEAAQSAAAAAAVSGAIPDRPQLVAAISAAIATCLGTDVSGLRIVSLKKAD